MFDETIITSDRFSVLSDAANQLFQNIPVRNSYREDYSGIAVARLLLKNRLGPNDQFNLYLNIDHSYAVYTDGVYNPLLNNAPGNYLRHGRYIATVFVVSLPRFSVEDMNHMSEELSEEKLAALSKDNSFTVVDDAADKKFVRLDDVERYLKNKDINTIIVSSPCERSTFIFTRKLNFGKYHQIISMFPRYCPWFFENNPLTNSEFKMLSAMCGDKLTDFVAEAESIASSFNIRRAIIERFLTNFEKNYVLNQKRSIENSIITMNDNIENCMNRLQRYILDKEEALDKLNALTVRAENADNELLDYFLCNKALTLIETHDSELTFKIEDYLCNFNKDIYRVYINKDTSYLNTTRGSEALCINEFTRRMVLDAIFDEESVRLRMYATFSYSVPSRVRYTDLYTTASIPTYFPNPHLKHFNCFGNNQIEIARAIQNGDNIGVIEACIGATTNFNVTDSVVGNRFIEELFRHDNARYKWFELKDGTLLNLVELVDYLKERKEKSNEQTD